MKVDVMLNRDGNIAQEGEMVVGKKTVIFPELKAMSQLMKLLTQKILQL